MHKTLSLDSLRKILKDTAISFPQDAHADITDIITDSRSVHNPRGVLFAALRTKVNDGARYIPELYARGVRYFIAERVPEGDFGNAVFIVVPDVSETLGVIAAALRRPSSTVVLVTGSTSKTQLKEALWLTLRRHRVPVFRSPRSFNSFLGVCRSVLDDYFGYRARVLIFEAAIDGPDQGERINHILRPDIGIITDITTEHDENFASHGAKINEKLNLLQGCSKIVYNAADPELGQLVNERFGNSATELIPLEDYDATALCRGAFSNIGSVVLPTEPMRTVITGGVRGNVLTIDNFTPDLSGLETGLERFVRHASPSRPKVLALGKMLAKAQSVQALLRHNGGYNLQKVVWLGHNAESGLEAASTLRQSEVFVFGAPTPGYDAFVGALERADHDTTLTVDLDALVHNFNQFRRMVPPQTGIVAMVKASAYGLGAIEVSKALQGAGAAYLAVAVVDEGVDMRRAGITMPIMVMNPVTRHYDTLFGEHLEPAVFSAEELQHLESEARALNLVNYPIHIKLDTGMHRVGFTPEQLPALVEALKGCRSLRVESVFSHLATADCLDKDEYTRSQLDCYYHGADYLARALGISFKRHILNTAGMMRFADCGPYDMARLGIGLYGISPLPEPDRRLHTVTSLTSVIISLKHWPAGTFIGYGNRGVVTKPSVIATIPIGYADGLDRRLGNGGTSFIVNGQACPTIGNICMDQCMVDVTAAPDATIGTKVEIFGCGMPVEEIARTLGTIPYEILTSVSPRVHRTYLMK